MSYTPAEDLLELTEADVGNQPDGELVDTYKRLRAANTGDATPGQADKIARLERAANREVSNRELWAEVYGQ